jgi:hypothetical protein
LKINACKNIKSVSPFQELTTNAEQFAIRGEQSVRLDIADKVAAYFRLHLVK